jgi:oxalate decarboxylase/phosphoglucose isomerase-like protein (cupin superfamily)
MKIVFVTLCILALIPIAAISQSNSPQSPVEISGEAHHHPKFENEFLRVWDVTVPAGEATLWHVHRNDNVVVTLGDANLRLENVTGSPSEAQWKFGEVRFAKATYTHRAMNIGTTPFHNFTVELLKPTNFAADPAALPTEEAGAKPILENERVRVYRLSLAPGEAQVMHTHPLPGLVVTLTAAQIEVTANGKAVTHPVKSNDVSWQAGGVSHSVRNVGQNRFESLIIEMK